MISSATRMRAHSAAGGSTIARWTDFMALYWLDWWGLPWSLRVRCSLPVNRWVAAATVTGPEPLGLWNRQQTCGAPSEMVPKPVSV